MKAKSRIKSYKARNPQETIFLIRNILKENDLFTIEYLHQRDVDGFYSCSVILANNGLYSLRLQTNGKGTTLEYAFASAYAEFLERLQNNILNTSFMEKYIKKLYNPNLSVALDKEYLKKEKENKIEFPFVHSPDEQYLDVETILLDFFPIYKDKYDDTDFDKFMELCSNISIKDKILCLPYYDVFNKNICYMPHEFLMYSLGSNGMCAGNTCHESIIQGICEIFERYAMKTIFYNKLCPPIIEHSYFKGADVLNKIEILEEKLNCKIIIKDCSLGMELPVICVVYIEKDTRKYCVNFGADPNPITALERCTSELFQGHIEYKTNPFSLADGSIHESGNENSVFSEFYKAYTNNSGKWPKEFFMNSFSYKFNDYFKNYNSKSDEDDLEKMIGLIKRHNYRLFIRDSSFLGFPTYHVYIPGMSELNIDVVKSSLKNINEFSKNHFQFFNLKNLSKNRGSDVIKMMKRPRYSKRKGLHTLQDLIGFDTHEDVNEINYDLLMFMLSYRYSDYTSALFYIEAVIGNMEKKYSYYYCVRDYVKLKSDGKNEQDCIDILELYYDSSEVLEVSNDLHNKNNIFDYYNLPNCFNCSECAISQRCNYFDILKFESNLQKKKNEYFPKQYNLKKEFEFINKKEC